MTKKSGKTEKKPIQMIKDMKTLEKVCLVVLFVQIVFIAYTNFFMIPNTLDNDAAKLFLHALEIWRNKKIFLPNWSNMTTLELDCSALFAIPFYGIFKNVYVAFALSNLVFVGLYIYVFSILLERLSANRLTRLFTYVFLLIPFSFGQLLYYNMMFFSGGQYVVKALVPLMYVVVLTADELKPGVLVTAVFSSILTLIMGISSGPYIFVTGVIPAVIAYLVCDGIKKEKLKDFICDKTIYIAIVSFLAVLGELICLKKHVNTSGNSITLIKGSEIITCFLNKITAFFELLGGYAFERTSIISVDGLLLSFKCVVALAILIFVVISVIDGFKNQSKDKVTIYICISVIINFFVVWFTDSYGTARYLLVFVVPAFILVANYLERKIVSLSDKKLSGIIVGIIALTLISELVVSDFQVLTDRAFPDFANENKKFEQIVEFVNGQPEEHVFVMNDNGQPEVYRIFDLYGDKEYLVYLTETQTIEVHDYYWSDEYYDWLDGEFLLIGCDSNTSIDMMPEDIVKRSEKIGSVQNYSIYRIYAK